MSSNLFHNLPELARNGGFTLCEGGDGKDDQIDWRFIGELRTRSMSFEIISVTFVLASIDTPRIIRESDFEKLEQCIPFLIRSSVGNLLNVGILDPAIARIYIVSQLCLQYLLFCTKFLDKSVYSLRENIFDNQKKNLKLEEVIEKRNEEIGQLQKKLKRQDTLNQPVFPCKNCTKNFLSVALLNNHILRKHPSVTVQESKDKDSTLIQTIKLELEVKQLNERLNATEKELMEASLKSMKDCEKCHENARRNFQSVAVQSNFEEKEKDDIEKDAIYELLNNQMKHFEEWKQNEEVRYRSEITELRTKLDQTIETLKDVAAQKDIPTPSPAPRLRVISEKCVGTSKSSEALVPARSDEIVWKSRCDELEKKYEEHQHRMSLTVTSIQKTYNEKMSNVEETVKKLQAERALVHKDFDKRLEKANLPLSPKVIKKVLTHESSPSSDSDSEVQPKTSVARTVKPVEARSPEIAEIASDRRPEKIVQTYSDQKFLHYHKKAMKKAPPKTIQTTREQAEDIFNNRLIELGVSRDEQRMSKSEFNRVHSDMVEIRDATKKKHKSFFVTRKTLQSKVEKLFHQKNDRRDVKKKEKLLGASQKSLHDDSEITEIKPIHAEPAFSAAESKYQANKLFRSDLERMLKNNPSRQNVGKPQNSSPTLISPAPTREDVLPASSKKKVMFAPEEDDSDFDLSSFTSEVEEPFKEQLLFKKK